MNMPSTLRRALLTAGLLTAFSALAQSPRDAQ